MLFGQLSMNGASSSVTCTMNEHVATPHEFVAVAVTTVSPAGNSEPGPCGEYVRVGAGSPVAVAAKLTAVAHWPVAAKTLILPGHEIDGGVRQPPGGMFTRTVKAQ